MVLLEVRKSQAIRLSATGLQALSASGDPAMAQAIRLGIRTAIGPMTGLQMQRRLKWIETHKTLRLPACRL
jgi:hypothetical protein